MLSGLFGEQEEEHCDAAIWSSCSSSNLLHKKTPSAKPVEPRAASGFMGLTNQGATCYLNSLLQMFYMTPEFRSAIFSLDCSELGGEENLQNRRCEETSEEEVDQELAALLQSFGVPLDRVLVALRATHSVGLDQALDFLSQLEDTPPPRLDARSLSAELQNLFSYLNLVNAHSARTEALTLNGFRWKADEARQQQDIQELCRLFMDRLDRELACTSIAHLCKTLFEGVLTNKVRCVKCGLISTSSESFFDLSLQVAGCDGLLPALRRYCSPEVVSGYRCARCDEGGDAVRSSHLSRLPPILTFACSRYAFANGERCKIGTSWSFPLLLDMAPFLSDQEQLPERNEVLFIEDIWNLLSSSSPSSTIEELVDYVRLHLRRSSLASTKHLYLLQGVVLHGGSAFSGHYHAVLRDTMQEGRDNWKDYVSAVIERRRSKKRSGGARPGTDYVLRGDGDEVFLPEGGPLAKVAEVFRNHPPQGLASRARKGGKRGKISKEGQTVGEGEGLHFTVIARGSTWARSFKDSYGPCETFLRSHSMFFAEEKPGYFYLRGVLRLTIVGNQAFKDMLASLEVQRELSDSENEMKVAVEAEMEMESKFEEVLARLLGRLYDFDDESVTAAGYKAVEEGFGGTGETAYLIFYRHINLQNHFDDGARERVVAGSHDDPVPLQPPQRCIVWAMEQNEIIRQEQLRWETEQHLHLLRVVDIFTPSVSLSYRAPLFMLDHNWLQTSEEVREVEVDDREDIDKVVERCRMALGLPNQSYHLAPLRRLVDIAAVNGESTGSYYLNAPLASIDTNVGLDFLMIWPIHISFLAGQRLLFGSEHYPVKVDGIALEYDRNHGDRRRKWKKNTVSIWFPGSISPLEALESLAQTLGLDPLYTACYACSCHTAASAVASVLNCQTSRFDLRKIYHCGHIICPDEACSYSQINAVWWRSCTLFFERSSSSGEKIEDSLVYSFISKREIIITVDKEVLRTLRSTRCHNGQLKEAEQEEAQLQIMATAAKGDSIEVVKRQILIDLLEEGAAEGDRLEVEVESLLSMFDLVPERLEENINKGLVKAEVERFALEYTSKPLAQESDEMCVRVALRNEETLRGSSGTSGTSTSSRECTVRMDKKESIQKLREAAMHLLLGPGSGQQEEEANYCLRRMDWRGDKGELVLEKDLTHGLEDILLLDSGIVNGELLLLECGRPLRRGYFTVKVFVEEEEKEEGYFLLLGEMEFSATTTVATFRERLGQWICDRGDTTFPTFLREGADWVLRVLQSCSYLCSSPPTPATTPSLPREVLFHSSDKIVPNDNRLVVKLLDKRDRQVSICMDKQLEKEGLGRRIQLFVQRLTNPQAVLQGEIAELQPWWPPRAFCSAAQWDSPSVLWNDVATSAAALFGLESYALSSLNLFLWRSCGSVSKYEMWLPGHKPPSGDLREGDLLCLLCNDHLNVSIDATSFIIRTVGMIDEEKKQKMKSKVKTGGANKQSHSNKHRVSPRKEPKLRLGE